ncbi:MAG: hypothetical protein JST36_07040 [Bacteroidetes bacterium]|nr:hypothetical protein [Bacteroidota bacterium]
MSKIPAAPLLYKLLLETASRRRLWVSLVAMCCGMVLLFSAVLIWWNFNQLLHGTAATDDLGSTFLTVSKRVTNENMGHPDATIFSESELNDLRNAPQVQDLGIVQALQPRAYMSMQLAPGAGFSTIMVLESVPERFMDKKPSDWHWQIGNPTLPIILSSSFLSLYNYAFAPSQGLPQLSEETIKALPFQLEIGTGSQMQQYTARVVGFSDRITSLLVPESFVQYANGASSGAVHPSRVILKIDDPSSTQFAQYLADHNYVTNAEQLRWSKFRTIVESVTLVIGLLALMLLGISLLVFTLFIELTIARSRSSVQRLVEIGYSPKMLQAYLFRQFLPLLAAVVMLALLLGFGLQVLTHVYGKTLGLHFGLLPGWPLWFCALCLMGLLVIQLKMATRIKV